MATAPFGFHFLIQFADVSARFEKCCCRFFVQPTPPPEPSETVAATTAADPVDFEAMATEQNRWAKMQRLFGSSSLKIAFRQAGAQCLVGDVSTGVFCPVVPEKFRKEVFSF
jgi:hypothetical protein